MFRPLGVTQFQSLRWMLNDLKGPNDPDWNIMLVNAGNAKHFLVTLLKSVGKDGTK